jgi:hypothetical protein
VYFISARNTINSMMFVIMNIPPLPMLWNRVAPII